MDIKKRLLLGGAILVISLGIVFFWFKSKLDAIEKDTDNSIALSQHIKSVFKSGFPDYEYEPNIIEWENNFLVLELAANANFDVKYRTKVNELLGVDKNYPGNTIDKLIVLVNASIVKGVYEDTTVEAEQKIYELNYIDLKLKQIVRIDTVYGPLPKEYIKENDRRGYVRHPNDEEIVEKIRTK
ncbi:MULTISPECIES: hypothetical protein [unclassified Cellulophaga]|uniref:hypothetical protein n=1 Tax=unclassified Cellulophaga TaxID=2634405 RepID=UPI0026E1E00D|nr:MULTISPECIES: hypothetical protein [unclassified Cellulophaga]MDO6489871.1 hypothetical protein [Cellulophaga sp. 2_MG-2023]MDO6494935.1 hypothetical protein [Cellulophaga sp. 3_MG-2023]